MNNGRAAEILQENNAWRKDSYDAVDVSYTPDELTEAVELAVKALRPKLKPTLDNIAAAVLEETGLRIHGAYIFGAADDVAPDRHFVTLHVCAQAGEGEPAVTEPDKQDAWRGFSMEELPSNLYSPSEKFITAYLNTRKH